MEKHDFEFGDFRRFWVIYGFSWFLDWASKKKTNNWALQLGNLCLGVLHHGSRAINRSPNKQEINFRDYVFSKIMIFGDFR